jgi:hypothetical protein
VPIALKSGGLNLLEPSGPVQVCNGIALPLLYSGLARRVALHKFIVVSLETVASIFRLGNYEPKEGYKQQILPQRR